MCGLVGVAGALGTKEERAFKTLLRLDTLRGEDSTGVAVMSNTGAVTVSKDVGNAFTFLNTKKGKSAFYGWNKVYMGHNRYATKGAVNAENAHPFEFGDIVGAHNGTLKSHHTFLDGSKFKVDSQALYYHMSEEDVADTWKKLNGAAALVWIDKKTKTVNFLRNKERELYFAFSSDGKHFFWASEFWMLIVACSKEGIDIGKPVMFAENVHYSLNPETMEIKKEELEAYVAPPFPVYTSYYTSSETRTAMSTEQYNSVDKDKAIRFEVDVLKDFIDWKGDRKCNIMGVSASGLPVRIYGVDAEQFEYLLDVMATTDSVFEGKILNKTLYQIEVDIRTVYPVHTEHTACCSVCGEEVEAGKELVLEQGKIICQECNLDLLELNREGYV